MLRGLFGRGKRKRGQDLSPRQDDTIRAARVGDVLMISGLGVQYEGRYFFVERRHRYTTGPDTWYELVCSDGDTQVWIDWTEGYDLAISATVAPEPSGLGSIGLSEEDLVGLDEQHSIDNYVTIEGDDYYYRNSTEVFFFRDESGPGESFYHWDFLSENELRGLSITKWEGRPFEVIFSEVLSPDNITLYKGERPEPGRGRG